jgi:hypothetical protein
MNNENLHISAPGGFAASARGLLTPIILIIGLGFGISIYFLNNTAAAARMQHDMIENQVSRMADGIEVNNWLLSMPIDKRPRLLKPYSANRFIEVEKHSDR